MLPNRIALYLTAIGDLVAAVAPFVFDFGGSEKVIAYVGSIIALNAVVVAWLNGWQKYEERTDLLEAEVPGFAPVVAPSAGEPPAGAVGGKQGEQ
jgi:NADH:ubiquinone oxidoreductase subunit 6 (subunit J)